MGRPEVFGAERILDTASMLVGEGGPIALNISRVAEHLGAPSGSIYHRFNSRDALAAALWLRAVERFQDYCFEAFELDDAMSAARTAAGRVLSWSRSNLSDARLLLLYRSSDLLDSGWPTEFVQRNKAQRVRTNKAVAGICRRLGATTASDRRRVVYAVVDVPYAAARSSLAQGKAPPADLDAIVDDAVTGVLAGIAPARHKGGVA